MRPRQILLFFIASLLSYSLSAREIVVGVETIPKRNAAFIFTPVVLPDLFSAKVAFEYRIFSKFNLVIPIEAKWMDYRWATRLFDSTNEYPEMLRTNDNLLSLGWDIDFSQLKVSSGLGVKFFPFSESMVSSFYLKTLFMVGAERFFDYREKGGRKDSAVFTHVLTAGYSWVLGSGFIIGGEFGEEFIYHTNPIKNLPGLIISGFNPIMQFNLGFTI